jgi:hypothetical protein
MEKLKKHLQDIKNTLPIMLKFNSIDQSAFKALNKAVSECLSMLPEEKQNETSICYYTDSSDLNLKKH